ncbi:MAG: DUF2799 domain-containing protein [Bdellovibrionaceae bacterium]|nr:DUF2799 domain-containing protein [Pseudobdellovibrionaceae bacterium]
MSSKKSKLLFLSFFLMSSTSCMSYFTRKNCEKVNWFQHAYDIAMNGKRLEEDGRLKECQKAETEINSGELDRGFKLGMENYCKLDTALNKGASGEGFNYEFCDSNIVPKLKARYFEGLKKFCAPDYAYLFASRGGIYNNQCPKDMESAYVPRYRKGRQVYLKNQIASNEAQVAGIDSEIRVHQGRAMQITQLISNLPRTSVVSKTKQYDAATKSYKEQTAVTEDPEVKRKRDDLEYQLRQVNTDINSKQDEQRKLREDIHNMRGELEGLN